MIIKIVKGGCDLYPKGSIHNVIYDRKGTRLANRADWLPPSFELDMIGMYPKTKKCNACGNLFDTDHPFVDSGQKGQEECCIRCYERQYIVGRESYRNALKREIMLELGYSG